MVEHTYSTLKTEPSNSEVQKKGILPSFANQFKMPTFFQGRPMDGQKVYKRFLKSLIMKDVHIKTTMKYFIPIKDEKVKKHVLMRM